MKEQVREQPAILAAAERQMQAWALAQEKEDREMKSRGPQELRASIHPCIAITREAGAGGSEVANALGKMLGWQVCDRNMLDLMAERFRQSRTMLEFVDETEGTWVYDVLGTWLDHKIIPHEKYVAQLTRVVWSAARIASCVFVGRAAQFVLPREKSLAVRIVASPRFRAQRLALEHHLDSAKAERLMQELDRGRREFVTRYFHQGVDDPRLYDITLNSERLGIERTVRLIASALADDPRFKGRLSAEAHR
ncbi:MAG: AAA family ATPase [Planctomycetota bacterium]